MQIRVCFLEKKNIAMEEEIEITTNNNKQHDIS